MGKKEEFEHESVQDPRTISQYLQALIQGFESGRITFNIDDDEFSLFPNNLIEVEIKARRKGEKNKLSLKFSWKENRDGMPDSRQIKIGS